MYALIFLNPQPASGHLRSIPDRGWLPMMQKLPCYKKCINEATQDGRLIPATFPFAAAATAAAAAIRGLSQNLQSQRKLNSLSFAYRLVLQQRRQELKITAETLIVSDLRLTFVRSEFLPTSRDRKNQSKSKSPCRIKQKFSVSQVVFC